MFSKLKRVGPIAAISVLTVAALSLTACTNGNPTPRNVDVNTVSGDLAGSIDAAIENALKLSGSTEAVVGVWQGDDKAYVRGYGEGVTGKTQFNSAQSGQPVICAALLDLVEQGKLSLNRKVSSDLNRQSGIGDITYGQLCAQTSGLADFKTGLGDLFVNNPTRPWPEQELLTNGLAHSPLAWPGLNVNLSDTNALLLDRALHQRTHQTTDEILKSHVFDPAGMSSSWYPVNLDDSTVPAGTLTPLTYASSGGAPVCDADPQRIEHFSPDMMRGAGSTITTVTDLKTFWQKYLSGGFGGEKGKSAIAELLPAQNPERNEQGEPTSEADPNGDQIGFGFEKVGPLSGRSGSVPGTISAAYSDPQSGLTVVVALNNSSAGAGFAKALAFQLAALTGAELPWSADDQGGRLTELAVCQAPAEEPPSEEG